jgi:uncharacterized membrane protein YkoI
MKVNRITTYLAVGLTALAAACASTKTEREQKEEASGRVLLAEMTAPARAAAERLTAGGKIERIDKEMEKGKIVYDVEANVGDKHMEYTIATDGAVVGTETGVDFKELPEAVQTATEKYFGRTTGLEPARVVEDGRTAYEIEGKKDGKKVAVTFDETGRLVEEEK